MTIDIRFFDAVTKNAISIDKTTGGFNFGVVRKGQQSEIKGVIIKNYGNETANGLSIKGSPLNSPTDPGVDATEYNRQVLAATWKYFSKLPNKNFQQILTLPSIPAGATMVGVKEIIDDFSNSATSNWLQDALSTHTWSWADGRLKCTMTGTNYARVDANGWGSNLNYDATFKLSIVPAAASGSTLGYIVLRAGGNTAGTVDNKGYALILKRTKTATTDTIFVDMYHGEGVTTAGVSQLTKVVPASPTVAVPYVDFAPMRVKLWNNTNGNPELKIWYNNINDTDTPLKWANNAESWIDVNNLYTKTGKTRICFGTGATNVTFPATFEIEEATLLTDDPEGKVYVKSIIGDGAEDNITYKSSMELFYDPPTV